MNGTFVVIVIFSLTVGILIGAMSMKGYQELASKDSANDEQISPSHDVAVTTPTRAPTQIPTQTEEQKIHILISSFQQAIAQRDVQKTMAFFTPPVSEAEIRSYQSLIGADAAGPRLFNNATSIFINDAWQITDSQNIQDGNMLKKRVLVEEKRRNWSQFEGGYSSPTSVIMAYDIVETNSEFKIANYYFYTDAGGAGGSVKYNGLGF